jgi:hypothetical protein
MGTALVGLIQKAARQRIAPHQASEKPGCQQYNGDGPPGNFGLDDKHGVQRKLGEMCLSGDRIGRIYKRLAKIAGIDATTVGQISGHFLRLGAAQDLLKNGATLPQIMVKGGWVKVDTVMRYVENTLLSPASGISD